MEAAKLGKGSGYEESIGDAVSWAKAARKSTDAVVTSLTGDIEESEKGINSAIFEIMKMNPVVGMTADAWDFTAGKLGSITGGKALPTSDEIVQDIKNFKHRKSG